MSKSLRSARVLEPKTFALAVMRKPHKPCGVALYEGGRSVGERKVRQQLLAEADALGVSEEAVLYWFKEMNPGSQVHANGVVRLFESRRVEPPNLTPFPAGPREKKRV